MNEHRAETYLRIETDPVDQPATVDVLERKTWSSLRIRISDRTVTRIWDKALSTERTNIYVPTLPIAAWLLNNWWSLLYEARIDDEFAISPRRRSFDWYARHCLRTADSGSLLPRLFLYSDGRFIHADWLADIPGALPHMPGEFVDSGSATLSHDDTETALSQFVSEVMARIGDNADERVSDLRAAWDAIQGADTEERAFCAAAGRLGINPYDPAEMTDELAAFIEAHVGNPDNPLAQDVFHATHASDIAEQWSWVLNTTDELHLAPALQQFSVKSSHTDLTIAANFGYAAAQEIRKNAGSPADTPVNSIESLAKHATGATLSPQYRNHIPGASIRAVAGWSSDRIVVAGPEAAREDSRRFSLARGLFHGLYSCAESPRLVSNAHTWDQRASRAFAAELLAPTVALLDQVGDQVDGEQIDSLADEFKVSSRVIEHQLQNAGIAIPTE
jgi:hypothetical protein